jgi:hypothetical protein
MSESYFALKEQIDNALNTITDNQKPNIAKLSRDFCVPYQRLRARWLGRGCRTGGQNKALKDCEELALCQILDRMEKTGIHAWYHMIAGFANSILKRAYPNSVTPPTVSKLWAQRFLNRHPEYFVKKQKPLAADRMNTHDPDELLRHFERFRDVRDKYGIHITDTYNFDETGFRIRVGRAQRIITRDAHRKAYIPDPDNHESLTAIETISGDGHVLPPMLILSSTQHLEKWFFDGGLEDKTLVAVTETGYTNDDILLQWFEHFDLFSSKRLVGVWRILVSDGYGSHLGIDFIQQCWDKNIIPFCLPPHTTHLLQPLDVVCFQPLKHYHGEAIDRAVWTGDTEFTKVEFLAAFNKIRHQTFKESTVKSAFRKTGLIPYDPTIVINAMREYEPRVTPLTSPLRTNNLQTPRTFNEINIMADNINLNLAKPSLSPSLGIQIGWFMKGTMAKLQSGAQAEEDLLHTQAAEAARAARKKGRSRVV